MDSVVEPQEAQPEVVEAVVAYITARIDLVRAAVMQDYARRRSGTGRHQHDIDELARIERICLEQAEESRVPGKATELPEMVENYGRGAAKWTVAGTVDCSLRVRKRRVISARLTGHPFRPRDNAGTDALT